MNEPATGAQCQCSCGKNHYSVAGRPLLRGICHCTICQEFNQADRADIVMYRRDQVEFPDDSAVRFRVYKKPALVQRGACESCGKPVIEYVRMPFFPELVIVPAPVHVDGTALPGPQFHMFYHRRKADVSDVLPKYSGFLGSQLGFLRHLLAALRQG